ncbi:serpin B [Arachidicoccus rhizosphaerae]|uniref:Serpin B n=2 Tax=Arachidicoccus rhizosphaerae TaxID=551991 RepID=A0A1H4B608_9BACT|nr:serpin B [Arachidicoccus rhizosphaerae]
MGKKRIKTIYENIYNMKNLIMFSTLLGLGVIGISGCSKAVHSGSSGRSGESGHAPVKTISISQASQKSVNDFSFNLLHQVEAAAPTTDNFFISPLSLHMDLGMVLNGAEGTTYDEMLHTLGLEGKSLEQANTDYQTLLTDLPKADPEVQLGLYNSIWYKNTFSFKQDYLDLIGADFDATIKGLPFKKEDASYINDWASEKTNGKIKKVLKEINPEDVMFLVNALYFKGDWALKFDKSKTNAADFTLEDGRTKQVQMMHQTSSFKMFAGLDYSAVRLPYGNGQFVMTVLLPASGKSLNEVFGKVSSADWGDMQQHMLSRELNLGLPRFSIPAYEFNFNDVLKSMGMKAAFDQNNANFGKMTANHIFVNFVKQNTYLKVDEEGTEAAAVTTTGMATTSVQLPVSFICDRPFGIIISEQTSNTILFMGKIMNPESD